MSAVKFNLVSKLEFGLRFRSFHDLRVKGNRALLCLKGRDYSNSSVPIRYIPERNTKVNESRETWPKKWFERKLFDKGSDGEKKSFTLGKKARNANQSGLMEHQFVGNIEEVIEESRIQENVDICEIMQEAEKVAVELLAVRAYTAIEMRKKLLGKKFSPSTVDTVVSSFRSRGLINDGLYAEAFCQSKWSNLSWGPGRIKQAMSKKGISEADAENALQMVFKNNEAEGEGSKLGLSKTSMDELMVRASKQWHRAQNVPKETRKSRIIRWLQYRGFNWGVISFVLKELESGNPS